MGNTCRGQRAAAEGEAYICPASDGGYVMLSLPSIVPAGVFDDVEWSSQHTCVSQIEALRRSGLTVRVGPTLHDIDTPIDVQRLLELSYGQDTTVWIRELCTRTLSTLKELNREGDDPEEPQE